MGCTDPTVQITPAKQDLEPLFSAGLRSAIRQNSLLLVLLIIFVGT